MTGNAPYEVTSYHVQRALVGDAASLEWVIARLSPLLRAQVAYRLSAGLRSMYEPEDLVQEAWLALLPRLPALKPRDGRYTPVMLKFLSTTVLHRIRNLTRKHLSQGAAIAGNDAREPAATDHSAVVTQALREERHAEVRRCLDELSPPDREVLILRGIEQQSIKTSALLLGIGEEAVAKRYLRALERLRRALPKSVFDELEAE